MLQHTPVVEVWDDIISTSLLHKHQMWYVTHSEMISPPEHLTLVGGIVRNYLYFTYPFPTSVCVCVCVCHEDYAKLAGFVYDIPLSDV